MNWHLVWFFVQEILAYELKCPVESHRKLRVKTVCEKRLLNHYSCLLNEHSNTYKESCTDAADYVRPGQKYVIGNYRKNTNCDKWRYQPFKFWSHQFSQCVFNKAHCNEAGQIMLKFESTFSDSVCRCDNTQGFAFVFNPKEHCYCIPSNEDCTCYRKSCPSGYFLTSDYQCNPSLSEYSSCQDVKPLIPKTEETINKPLYEIDRKNVTSIEQSYTPKVLFTILLFLLVSVFIISKFVKLGMCTKKRLCQKDLLSTIRTSEKRQLYVDNEATFTKEILSEHQQDKRKREVKKQNVSINYVDFQRFLNKIGLGMFSSGTMELSDVMQIYGSGMPRNLKVEKIKEHKRTSRPLRPLNKDAVIAWFRDEEKERSAVLDPQTNEPGEWFHGIVSRKDAEKKLTSEPIGSYLVRLSNKVWGYVISYKASEGFKHYIVDRVENGYQFLSDTFELKHATLADLILFHVNNPIPGENEKKLLKPIGQINSLPDYHDLFNT